MSPKPEILMRPLPSCGVRFFHLRDATLGIDGGNPLVIADMLIFSLFVVAANTLVRRFVAFLRSFRLPASSG